MISGKEVQKIYLKMYQYVFPNNSPEQTIAFFFGVDKIIKNDSETEKDYAKRVFKNQASYLFKNLNELTKLFYEKVKLKYDTESSNKSKD